MDTELKETAANVASALALYAEDILADGAVIGSHEDVARRLRDLADRLRDALAQAKEPA